MTTPHRSYTTTAADGPPHLPRGFTDAADRDILLDTYEDDDFGALVGMYERFDPADRALGLPPLGESQIRSWLDGVLRGVSILAWHGDEPIGHAMFVPDGTDGHELAVFVRGAYHDAGIGSELVQTGLAYLRATGGQTVWLAVDRWNDPALHLYRKVGFTVDESFHSEVEMSYDL